LALRLTVGDSPLVLISIYGPNSNDQSFFSDLRKILDENKSSPIVCGGDWNTTYSTLDGDNNIDTFSMLNPPSLIRSSWLNNLCDEFNLIDPYRAFHPNRRDYTYVPRAGTRNRSRIDFFLIQDNLLRLCNSCYISHSLESELFDHKSISLSFAVKIKNKNHFINPVIFGHCRFNAIVATAAAETYLQHAARDQGEVDIEEGLLHVGRLIEKITQCNELDFSMAFDGMSDEKTLLKARYDAELQTLVDSLPDPDSFSELLLTCDPDIFLEVLMGNIRNSLISFQAWHQKVKMAKTQSLTLQLGNLKKDYFNNIDIISRLERELTEIRDNELSAKIRELKIFEHLHNEKPSPLFLNLVRCSGKENLSNIRGERDEILTTREAREKRFIDYFSDVYRKKTSSSIDYETCIENFLGPEILNNPIVRNSRLTEDERVALDRPLTYRNLMSPSKPVI
jgi:hypothetical protein